jgi:DNA anti-recombination protein RmuC
VQRAGWGRVGYLGWDRIIRKEDSVSAVDDLTRTVKDAAYVAVGFGVLGFQQAQVRRRALVKDLQAEQAQDRRSHIESRIESQLAEAGNQLAEARTQLACLAREVEQRLEPVMVDLSQRAEPVLEEIESRLPDPARGVWSQVRQAAKDTQEQLRARRPHQEG